MITVSGDEIAAIECVNVIIAPEAALHQAGYIKTLTAEEEANAKHKFFALAQMAFFQYEDDEIKAEIFSGPLAIRHDENEGRLEHGLVICQDEEGRLRLLAHKETNVAKLLEVTNRFCTRWVRLDISCPEANPPHHTIS
jgi:hypothetical protein